MKIHASHIPLQIWVRIDRRIPRYWQNVSYEELALPRALSSISLNISRRRVVERVMIEKRKKTPK